MTERNASYGIRLTADGEGLVGAVDKSSAATGKLTEQMQRLKAASKDAGDESAAFVRRVRDETEGVYRWTGEAKSAIEAKRQLVDTGRQQTEVVNAGRIAQAAMTSELRQGAAALKTGAAETLALVAAQGGLRTAIAGLVGVFTGPAGIITALAAAAFSWVSFGNDAEAAGNKAAEAGRKAREALPSTQREQSQARLAAIGLEIQGFSASIQDLDRPGQARTDEEKSFAQLQKKVFQDLIQTRVAEAQRLGSAWPNPTPSIADATRGMRSSTAAFNEYQERVHGLYAAYGPEIEGAATPEHRARMQAELVENALAARRQYDAQLKSFEPKGAGRASSGGGGGGVDDGAALLLGLKNQLATVSGETSTYDTVLRKLTEGTKAYLPEVREQALALAAGIDAQRTANDEAKAAAAAATAKARAEEEATKAYNAGVEQQWKSINATQEQNAKLAQHNREIGLSRGAVDALRASTEEMTLAQLENERALVGYKDDEDPYVKILDARIAAQRELIGLLREGAVAEASAASAKKSQEEWQRASDNIERSLTDSIMRGFDGGKSFFRNFLDSLVNGFKTAVLQPIIAPIVRPVAQALGGLVSGFGGGGSGSGGGGGGFGGMGDLISMGSSASNLFSGNGIMGGIGQALGLGGSAISGAGWATAGGGVAVSGLGGAAGGGLMAGIGTALPWIGGALAVGSMLGLFDEGGGPKPQEVIWNNGGSLGFGDANITSQDPAYYAAAQQATQDLWSQFSHEELATVPRMMVTGEPGSDPFALLERLKGQVMSALGPVQQRNQAMLQQLQGGGLLTDNLQGWLDGQAVSDYLSPEEKFKGARSLYDSALERAGAGDAEAGRALPGLADQLIGAGRGMYASSTRFHELRGEVAGDFSGVLEKQGALQADLLAEMPAAVREGAKDTVAALDKLRKELVAKFDEMASALRQGMAPT